MQFEDATFRHNNSIALYFRNQLTYETDKVAELAEEACSECFDEEFNEIVSSSVQDLDASEVAKELNVEKVEFDMHQVDEVGVSAVGELTRSKDKVKCHACSLCSFYKILALKSC